MTKHSKVIISHQKRKIKILFRYLRFKKKTNEKLLVFNKAYLLLPSNDVNKIYENALSSV